MHFCLDSVLSLLIVYFLCVLLYVWRYFFGDIYFFSEVPFHFRVRFRNVGLVFGIWVLLKEASRLLQLGERTCPGITAGNSGWAPEMPSKPPPGGP